MWLELLSLLQFGLTEYSEDRKLILIGGVVFLCILDYNTFFYNSKTKKTFISVDAVLIILGTSVFLKGIFQIDELTFYAFSLGMTLIVAVLTFFSKNDPS